MAQGLGFLPLTWETQTELLAPDFDLAQPWLLQALASAPGELNWLELDISGTTSQWLERGPFSVCLSNN